MSDSCANGLSAQAASGYISYEAASETFFLTAEQTAVFADPDSPAAMTGGFYGISSVYHDEPLDRREFSDWSGSALGKASHLPFLRDREVFSSRLSGQHQRELDTRA